MSALSILGGPQAWLAENGTKLALCAAAAAALWLHGCHTGEMRKEKELGAMETKLGVCAATTRDLSAGLDKQNEGIEATKKDGDARVAKGLEALARAQATIDRLSGQIAASGAYQRPAGQDECAAARAIVEKDNEKK